MPSTLTSKRKRAPVPALGPWAITQEGLELCLAVWSRGSLFAAALERARAEKGEGPYDNDQAPELERGICEIPIHGPLFKHADLMSDLSGATSYERIDRDLDAALVNPECRGILLCFDSPGGEVKGCGELAAKIRAADAQKPVYAYAEGQCCSAAYHLASATRRIYAAPTATLGSIGVLTVLRDDSAAQEKEGERRLQIVSSQSPGKRSEPVDEDVVARAQTRVDAMAEVFIADVARYRGVAKEKVLADYGQGDVFVGAYAVKAGLADELGTHEAAERGLEQVMSKAPEAPQAPAPTAALDPTQALLARLGGDPAKALNRLAELELDAASAKALQGEVEKLKAAKPERPALLPPVKAETRAWLAGLRERRGVPVDRLAAQILDDVAADDLAAHAETAEAAE